MSCLGSNYNPANKRTWSRLENSCIYSKTYVDNSTIHKQQVLNYPKNKSTLTKNQIYALMSKGNWIYKNKSWATQGINYTNPNTRNLLMVNDSTLICNSYIN